MKYLIWSNKHGQWWGPEHAGYCDETAAAGRYSFEEAGAIVVGSGLPNENVAVADAPGCIAYWVAR